MIRTILGTLVVMGAVGGMEHDPATPILVLMTIAVLGLGLMYWGVRSIQER